MEQNNSHLRRFFAVSRLTNSKLSGEGEEGVARVVLAVEWLAEAERTEAERHSRRGRVAAGLVGRVTAQNNNQQTGD